MGVLNVQRCNKPTTYSPIKRFNCYKYNSFERADYVWNITLYEYKDMKIRHTIIPLCKWIPEIFDKYIINYKLRKMYWLGNNTFGTGDTHKKD
jgi:hypothetical protein